MGIRSVFCEGGGRLASELIRQAAAQRLYLFVAPFVLGKEGVPAFTGLESKESWKGWKPVASPQPFGRDLLLTYDRTD
jgi:riboflavin biosynthesis pyrimidine reductase